MITQIVDGAVSQLASGVFAGTVREEEVEAFFGDAGLVLDIKASDVFTAAAKRFVLT